MEDTLKVEVDKVSQTAKVTVRITDTVVVTAMLPISDVQSFVASFNSQME